MYFHVSEDRTLVDSAEIDFVCVRCGEQNLTDALRFKTIEKLYGLVPIWVSYETAIKCEACAATQRTSASLENLAGLSPEQMGRVFRVRISFVHKFMVIVGWIIIFFAPMSFVLHTIAWFGIPKAATRWSRSALGGMIVSAILSIYFIAALFMNR